MTTPSTRVMVFIDGSNLYHTLRENFGRTDLKLEAFCAVLVAGRTLVRAYYYNALIDQTKDPTGYRNQQRFLNTVQRLPYFEIRVGHLVYRDWPTVPPFEKGIDIKIGTDMLVNSFRRTYDTAILVSGDTDYRDALQAVKDNGSNVEVALFGGPRSSQALRDVADRIIEVNATLLAPCWP